MIAATDISTVMDGPPVLGVIALGIGLVMGLILWLLGRRLAKPVCVLTGLLIGAALGFVCAQGLGFKNLAIASTVVGSAAGATAAWLLFRFWMGLSLAIVLAVAVPTAALMWGGESTPVAAEEVKDQFVEITKPLEGEEGAPGIQERIAAAYRQQADEVAAWWEGLGPGGRRVAGIGTAAGAIVGLLIGLVLPKIAASIQSSLVGGALILTCSVYLLRSYATGIASHLPEGPRAALIAICLITALGIGLQWTLSRRKADK